VIFIIEMFLAAASGSWEPDFHWKEEVVMWRTWELRGLVDTQISPSSGQPITSNLILTNFILGEITKR
jgi:hypothetical protein